MAQQDSLRGVSNSLGDYRKVLPPAFAGANGVASHLMSVNYPHDRRPVDRRPVLSDPDLRESFLKDLNRRYLIYVWNMHLLWTSCRDLYEKHGGPQTFPEFAPKFPDKTTGFPAFVFDLFNVMRNDGVRFSPRPVERQWSRGGRWMDLDVFLALDQVRSLRFTKPGGAEYALTLNADVSMTELHGRFNDLMLDFGCWFESELRRIVLMTMGRTERVHHPAPFNGTTRRAGQGEIRCAGRDFEPFSGMHYASAPRCENVAEFHWTSRDGSQHQVLCERHAANASRIGLLSRVTPDNPATVTEQMVIEWGSPEESEAAKDAYWNRNLVEGHTMYRDGVLYHPDGTTSVFPPSTTE